MGTTAVPLEGLDLLQPGEIPNACARLNKTPGYSLSNGYHCFLYPGSRLTNLEVAGLLKDALTQTHRSERVFVSEHTNAEDAAHDLYFHVTRVAGDAGHVFARACLSARLILLEDIDEAPVTVDRSLLDEIDRALADLSVCFHGAMAKSAVYVHTWKTRGICSAPMTRWIRGHQIFATLSQGLIFSFRAMGSAIRAGQWQEVCMWADLTISLLRGSGAAFVLTADFSMDEYLHFVRPTMMPPASAVNLSGLMSVDHRVLVQTIRDLKPALKALHEQEPGRHDSIERELSLVYDRHIHVCERFVGERPSLLTARHAKKSGPALIEQFKSLRMKPFDSSRHAERLAPAPIRAQGCSARGHAAHCESSEIRSKT